MYYFESVPVKIGKHEWRMVVKDSTVIPGTRSTEYQYRRDAAGAWRPDTTWPTYNSHDGTYAGCPKSLCNKVFRPNERAIEDSLVTREMLYKTARLRPDIDKTWTPRGFEPGELVAVKYWTHQYDATTGIYRPIYYIAKTHDFAKHIADGEFATVYNSALDSFVL